MRSALSHMVVWVSVAARCGAVPAADTLSLTAPTPVGYWKLDGNAQDSSGNAFHGTVTGNVTYGTGAFGAGSLAGQFSGNVLSNQTYITMPSNATLNDLTEQSYTFSAWANPASIPVAEGSPSFNTDQGSIFVKQGFHNGLRILPSARFLGSRWNNNVSESSVTSVGTYSPGNWHHLAWVADLTVGPNGQGRLYVDGALQGTANFPAGPMDHAGNPFRIGIANTGGSFIWPFHGSVDDAILFAQPLSEAVISSMAFLGANAGADYTDVTTLLDFEANGNEGDTLDLDGRTWRIAPLSEPGFAGLGLGQGAVIGSDLFLNLGSFGLTTGLPPLAPEPASLVLFAVGLAVAAGAMWRRRR